MLWYQEYNDRTALATLLEYNKEDVMNLKVLREKMDRKMRLNVNTGGLSLTKKSVKIQHMEVPYWTLSLS